MTTIEVHRSRFRGENFHVNPLGVRFDFYTKFNIKIKIQFQNGVKFLFCRCVFGGVSFTCGLQDKRDAWRIEYNFAYAGVSTEGLGRVGEVDAFEPSQAAGGRDTPPGEYAKKVWSIDLCVTM